MSRDQNSSKTQIDRWASRQLADYDAGDPGTLFGEGVVMSLAEAYELQSAVAELRRLRGEGIIGYKVGCTSPVIRKQLGIDHCVTGRLFDSERHLSGATLSRRDFANLAIEGELSVELSHTPTKQDFLQDGIPACVARVFPVIELHHYVMRGEKPSASELVANNAIHGGFVTGNGILPEKACGEASLDIFADDRLLDACKGPSLIETIRSSLKWLMEFLQNRGEQLSSGQIILTGSIPSLIRIEEDCRIRVEAPPFGNVEVNIIG
jgi:2-keto-4-pentenoate hydratase